MTRVRTVTVPDMKPDEWSELDDVILFGAITGGGQLRLASTMPESKGPIVLRLNGEFLLRADWPIYVEPGDEVEWHVDQPGDREEFRVLLQVAAVVAAVIPGLQFAAPYLAAASVAYNLLVPPTVLQQPNDPTRSLFNASLTGNAARLDDPIWRTYGIDRITPPFAGQPYYRYDDNGDQYFYAVLCGGYGPVDVLAAFIGKTPVNHFADVIKADYLAPGVQPSVAKANVYTSSEVAGMELEVARYVGGFIACKPGQVVKSISCDFVAPQGLGKPVTEDDDDPTVTVSARMEWREVNDAGAPLSEWRLLNDTSKHLATNTPVRWTVDTDLTVPCRPEIRCARSNPRNTSPNARDGIQWAGLRAELKDPAPLSAYAWHYEIVMRGSEQLSAQSQTDFNLIVQGKARTWSPVDGWSCDVLDFDNYVAVRNPAWAAADVCADPIVGEGLPDERIDLASLYALSLTWEARQDRFDFTFSSRVDAWAAGQLIASSGRARMFRRYGVRSWARDELATMGETAISARTIVKGTSMPIQEKLSRGTDPDGIVVEYLSNRTWGLLQVECPAPGFTTTSTTDPIYNPALPPMSRPEFVRYEGIKGYTHARREGLYHAADGALRQRKVTAKTEMQALVQAFLLPVRFMPQIAGYGQTGDVAFWNADTLVMTLTEKPDFSKAPLKLTLRRDDGSLTAPVVVTPGPTANDVVLPALPDFEIVTNAADRMRPVFLLGGTDSDLIAKVSSIRDGGKSAKGAQYYAIDAVIDDPRVHTVDNALLPGPGTVQDPVDLPGDDPGGGTLVIVTLGDQYIVDGQPKIGGGISTGVRLNNDGTLQLVRITNDGPNPPAFVPNQWLLVPVESAVAALFEAKASAVYGGPFSGDLLDTWLELGTTRQWDYGGVDNTGTLNVQIRRIGDETIQQSRNMYLTNWVTNEGGGA